MLTGSCNSTWGREGFLAAPFRKVRLEGAGGYGDWTTANPK